MHVTVIAKLIHFNITSLYPKRVAQRIEFATIELMIL